MIKKITLSLSILCLLASNDWAQTGTWAMLTSGTSTNLLAVSVVDVNICYVSGNSGKILKTTNGGVSWSTQTSGTSFDLYSICFTDANNGIAVGTGGTVRRTTNGGTTWTSLTLSSDDFRCVRFYDVNTGYITGGISGTSGSVFKTTDGGATWASQTISASSGIYSVKFTSATDGFVSDYGGEIFKTVNGGASWNLLSSGVSSVLYGIDFTSSSNGIAVGGSGVIRRTIDGGANWSGVLSGTSDPMTGLCFADINNGFAVGGNVAANTGMVVSTVNGGSSWSVYTPGCSRLYGVDFLNINIGYAAGLNGTIIKYTSNVGIDERTNSLITINTFPNPASGSTTVDLSGLQPKGCVTIKLYNISGELIRTIEMISTDQSVISQDGLSAGEYFFSVSDSEKMIGSGKVIFK